MRGPPRLVFHCKICRKMTKFNVGTRRVPICPECRNEERSFDKYLKWLWEKDRKMFYKESQRKGIKLSEDLK